MLINGIDLDGLAHEASDLVIPEPVKGRVLHIDADFLAYMTTAERADGTDTKTWDDMKHNAEEAIHTLKALAGATALHLHLTPSTSDKGGRFEIARLKPYQGNRIDKPKPRYLGIMREWLAKEFPGTLHQLCEADDGMSSAQYASIKEHGHSELSIIASKDKDLRMVPGLHLDWDAGSIHSSGTEFGYIELVGGKLKGYGQKFFWAQLLMGDTADNISGLPKLTGNWMNVYKPTKETLIAQKIADDPDLGTSATGLRARKKLADRSAGPCGPVMAYNILQPVTSNVEAFALVKAMFKSYGEQIGFIHYNVKDDVTWQDAFLSEAKLLWMRRDKHNPNCVVQWFKDIHA